ncbi:hypothetical protein BgiBS90_010053 [Biomphalaria glabrata]|nr:hypothetical protein BgiBS90_010053 [Biomphalaria glabrata]
MFPLCLEPPLSESQFGIRESSAALSESSPWINKLTVCPVDWLQGKQNQNLPWKSSLQCLMPLQTVSVATRYAGRVRVVSRNRLTS